jgi:23S rRNA pseudouridine2605 synthase
VKRPFSQRPQRARPGAGLARALSKLGFCSRSQGVALVRESRVRVNGAVRTDPEWAVNLARDRIEVDGAAVGAAAKVYLMLNKPRGLVTTAADEQGRATVFACLEGKGLPPVSAVGRLDKASEGLLLLSNDTHWAARVTAPESHLDKTYHVQVNRVADDALIQQLKAGAMDAGERLTVKRAALLRRGERNSWLEIVLDEGRNRHIRRLLAAFGIEVLRLIRVAVGPVPLGNLAKGEFRHLTADEAASLSQGGKA